MTGGQQARTIGHMLSFGVGRTGITQKVSGNILVNIWANGKYNTNFLLYFFVMFLENKDKSF